MTSSTCTHVYRFLCNCTTCRFVQLPPQSRYTVVPSHTYSVLPSNSQSPSPFPPFSILDKHYSVPHLFLCYFKDALETESHGMQLFELALFTLHNCPEIHLSHCMCQSVSSYCLVVVHGMNIPVCGTIYPLKDK